MWIFTYSINRQSMIYTYKYTDLILIFSSSIYHITVCSTLHLWEWTEISIIVEFLPSRFNNYLNLWEHSHNMIMYFVNCTEVIRQCPYKRLHYHPKTCSGRFKPVINYPLNLSNPVQVRLPVMHALCIQMPCYDLW